MMATKTQKANTLVEAAAAIAKLSPNTHYKSAAALVEAAAPGTPRSIATQVRGVMRNTNQAVGRGNRYNGITPRTWASAYKQVQAQKTKAKDTAKAAKAAKPKKAAAHKSPAPAALVGAAPTGSE